ncbi:outer membrane beta-barrel protein [Pedobacter sp. V48]|uniref:outer membrane beta-barrel protein n=1 Tax=Pedobacter sp. V48 TaxID=509635 RepID=UPI0003E48A0A|nr:outer membrane beta-barrel protein [Pedobacter sp. V48]ETZ21344.1 hypothetical protein N824_28150 [Pedobacter sp. V48]
MKRDLLTIAFALSSVTLFAQKSSLTGVLIDSANQKMTINYATISIFKGQDTVLTTYKLSDDKGLFKISNLEAGTKYRLVVNAWQYLVLRKEVTLTTAGSNVDLGNLLMSVKTNALNEVVIYSERPPIIVRKDTIEFNAGSFKTLPTAVVDDLLKKLPGVTVAANGSIQVNGKDVSKILVDGKEFFGGDQQIATKNLPANIIDKVQVTDDQEAKRQDPDLLAGNVPQVINLKLKKAIKQGAFGKLYAGGGLKELYETGGILNFFRDTTQLSLLAYGNDVNKPGFNVGEISRIGGFSRSGINSMYTNSDGAAFVNDISFGGSSAGVQRSTGAGANFNTLTNGGIKVNGKYFFGSIDNYLQQIIDANQNLGIEKLHTTTNSNQRNKNYNHNIGAKAEWQIDTLTKLTLEPSVVLRTARNNGFQQTEARNAIGILLNNGINDSRLRGANTEYYFNSNFWKDFKKPGRTFYAALGINKRDNLNDNFNVAKNDFYNPPSNSVTDQLRDNNISNFGLDLNANYAEPISKVLALSFAIGGNYLDNENALFTFYKNPLNQAYDIAVPTLSETVTQSGYKSNSRASLKWKITKDFNIQPGFVLNTIDLQNNFSSAASFEQHYRFIAPSLTVRYKTFSLDYSPSFREPDVKYIQPVANNSNPLFVQEGNPNLRPARTHQIGTRISKYDTKRSLNYFYNGFLTFQKDAIVMSRVIRGNGVQVNTPVNEDGIWQFNGGGFANKEIKNGKNQFTFGGGFWLTYNHDIVLVNSVKSFSSNIALTPRLNTRLNLNDKFEFAETYNLGINKSSYDDPFYSDLNFLVHTGETEMVVRFPKKMVWETSFKLQYNTQTVAGFNNTIQIWNAGLTFLFLKNDKAQLKFAVNDILNTNTRRSINISENYIRDISTNNLGRHGLLTLTYNIQNFGGKVGGRDTFFRF